MAEKIERLKDALKPAMRPLIGAFERPRSAIRYTQSFRPRWRSECYDAVIGGDRAAISRRRLAPDCNRR
jgi:hypothetical protein